jgi:Ca2+-binding EF-hand superfamily protein
VNPTEFATWLRAIGVDQSQANAAFQAIDTNGDGNLDSEELLEAIRQYHQGENDIPLLGR